MINEDKIFPKDSEYIAKISECLHILTYIFNLKKNINFHNATFQKIDVPHMF